MRLVFFPTPRVVCKLLTSGICRFHNVVLLLFCLQVMSPEEKAVISSNPYKCEEKHYYWLLFFIVQNKNSKRKYILYQLISSLSTCITEKSLNVYICINLTNSENIFVIFHSDIISNLEKSYKNNKNSHNLIRFTTSCLICFLYSLSESFTFTWHCFSF